MIVAFRWYLLEKAFLRFGMPVAVVDLESTGGNLYEDRVTEVALVKFGQEGRRGMNGWSILKTDSAVCGGTDGDFRRHGCRRAGVC